MDIDLLQPDNVIGAVCYNSSWHIYAGIIAEWILDYASYDPEFLSDDEKDGFRCGLLVVDFENAEQFQDSMAPYEMSSDNIRHMVAKYGKTEWTLSVVVNFDKRLFINGFHELPIHEYAPEGWTSREDDPFSYVDPQIVRLWQP